MRNIPGLTNAVIARAEALSLKARDARDKVPGVASPKASITPAKVAAGVATLRLYDYIDPDGGYWGISADEFAEALDNIEGTVSEIVLRINSGGGSVWDGLAILNTLRSHEATVTAVVDGIAASAASFIAVACDDVVMMPNSRMMIHDALGICLGQAADMREYADFLSDSSDNIAEIYAAKAGGTSQEWRDKMTANGLLGQWYTAQQAVDVGLADSVGGQAEDDEPADKTPAMLTPDEARAREGLAPVAPEKDDTAPVPNPENQERRKRHQARRHAANAKRVGEHAA